MHLKNFARSLYTTNFVFSVEKSALGTLRKKTGYTFANCKKALELNNNDVGKAEHWLKEQAQAMGWAKAHKLEGRNTKQGLVGVLVDNNIAAMVEVNCETDFVARNKAFQQFVDVVLKACVNHVSSMPKNDALSKIGFTSDSLKQLTSDEKPLADHLALLIGNVGENATLRRAICLRSTNSYTVSGFAHPTTAAQLDIVSQVGRFGAIVALQSDHPSSLSEETQKNICQHIVGMNPTKIGCRDDMEPNPNKDEEECLVFQEYLLDPTLTVDELLTEHQAKVIDFHRFECGEPVQEENVVAEARN